jgi:WS/DGAT/MGAT family acyltransferase
MSRWERLSALDATFLYAESPVSHMHVGSFLVFEDVGMSEDEFFRHIESRLHLVPRFRKKIRWVPGGLHRPVWVDDPHFDLRFHVRSTGLPKPGGEREALALTGRLQSHQLDRRKPLWEIWLFDLPDGKRGMVQKTHHCLIDGASGVDLGTVLLDLAPDTPLGDPPPWHPEPEPTNAELVRDAVADLATHPNQIRDAVRRAVSDSGSLRERAREIFGGVASISRSAVERMPQTSLNKKIGPHRRFQIARVDLARVKALKNRHACTVNDVVLAMVAGGLRDLLVSRGESVDGLVLKAMVPVSVRDPSQRHTWGNKVSMMAAELPIGESNPIARLERIRDSMQGLKASKQAVGADFWVKLGEYSPPTVLSLAGRALALQRMVNLVVTNVPGPQFPLYLRGGKLLEAFPYVPVFASNPITVGVLSYLGQLGFGLTGDWDAAPDLEKLGPGIVSALEALESH